MKTVSTPHRISLTIPAILLVVFATAIAGLYFFYSPTVKAVTAADWRAGNIISDSVFYDANAMSEAQIQQFLNSKVPVCDNWGTKPYAGTTRRAHSESRGIKMPLTCLKDYRENTTTKANNLEGRPAPGGSKTAARIIWEAAQNHGINPKVLIALIQKEQSLIADDWPWPYQFTHATGYGCPDTAPCDAQYYGFYNQVERAAWQFRHYANNPNSFNHVAGRNNSIRWSPNAACGSGTVFIQNQATASLYNYTPYQPNQAALNNLYGLGDGCSAYGNRNFWRIFNDWFGSTHYNYSATHVETKFYTDAARTQEVGSIPTMRSGQLLYVTAKYRNSGNATWNKSFVRYGTTGPHNRSSSYHNESWQSQGRPAILHENQVAPGQIGTFNFSLAAPDVDATYSERFRVVAEGRAWMEGEALERYTMTVSNPYNATLVSLLPYQDTNYTNRTSAMLKVGEVSHWQMKIRNTGHRTWDANTIIRIGTAQPHNRASAMSHPSWINSSRPAHVIETNVAPGQIGTFNFSIPALAEPRNYVEHFQIVAEGVVWMPSGKFSATFRAFEQFDRLARGQILFAGDQITSGNYRLVMQGDGNLVLYRGNQALWSTGTRNANRVVLQGDGNLVLYNKNQAVWSTGSRNADRLIMQGDGNLVLYGGNQAIWNTGTR